jgi:putative transposase
MRWTLERLRELYNAALEERREAYRRQGVTLTANQQMKELTELRVSSDEYRRIPCELAQDAITRLDRAYEAFFRRAKAGDTPGFPRFQGKGRYSSFTFKGCAGAHAKKRWLVQGGRRLDITSVGRVKIKLHRPLCGRLKQVTVTLDADGHWYACLCCDQIAPGSAIPTGQGVGVDVGISTLLALSTGELVDNPRHFEGAHEALRRAQRTLSRRTDKRSRRRRKAAAALRARHARVRRTRLDAHHKTTLGLVRRFDWIAVEDLNIKGLARGRLAKQVHDAAWAQFIRILASKAECAGRELIRVNPRGTSQICSECGVEVRKDLRVRVHDCPHCGYRADRDVNAARNIYALGHSARGGTSNG